jgi:outer membrane protein assembly factor BamB
MWHLFVSGFDTNEVLYFDATTGAPLGTFASGGGLTEPQGLVFNIQGDQNLYVVGEQGVYRYNGQSGVFIDVFVPHGSGGLTAPTNLTFDRGYLLVTDASPPRVLRYNGSTGAPLGVFASGGGLREPSALAFGPDRMLYVTTEGSPGGGVLRYDGMNGNFLDAFVAPGTGGLDIPTGMVFGPNGNLFVCSSGTDLVLQFDGMGTFLGPFVTDGPGAFLDFLGIAFGPDGNLYVGTGRGTIRQYDGRNGNFLGQFNRGPDIGTPAQLTFFKPTATLPAVQGASQRGSPDCPT